MKPIVITYKGRRRELDLAIFKANDILRSDAFYDAIAAEGKFDLSTIDPATIAELMREANMELTVDLYYTFSPLDNIDGFDDPGHPEVAHLNAWMLERPTASIVNSLIHSCVHAVNAQHPEAYFGHGDHRLAGKLATAPYRIGLLAQQLLDGDTGNNIILQHEPPVNMAAYLTRGSVYSGGAYC